MSSFSKKGKRSSTEKLLGVKFNKNEVLTYKWVIREIRRGKPIFTNEVLLTLGKEGLIKVVRELEKNEIITFTDYESNLVVFLKKNWKNINIFEDGFSLDDTTCIFFPITPKNN